MSTNPAMAAPRVKELYDASVRQNHEHTSRIFAVLMGAQWLFGIILALVVSPSAWEGKTLAASTHVWAALLLGGVLSGLPIFLALTQPASALTRNVMAAAQMLWGALLIHLTGGRIETHFHIFGSLAFVAFYRDLKPVAVVAEGGQAAPMSEGVFTVMNKPFDVSGAVATLLRAARRPTVLVVDDQQVDALEAASPATTVSLAAAREGEAFVARVSNTGPDFPANPADAMDPFFSPGAKTLGRGLPVARAVALSHGGELRLAHEAGTSVATLTLPGVAP